MNMLQMMGSFHHIEMDGNVMVLSIHYTNKIDVTVRRYNFFFKHARV